jgi:predicted RNA-binding protein with PUA domain
MHISVKKKLEFYISNAVIYICKQANLAWYENKVT